MPAQCKVFGILRLKILLLALGIALPAQADSLLERQADTVLLLNAINVAHLEGLEQCLCELRENQADRGCREQRQWPREEFRQVLINLAGEVRAIESACADVVERLLVNRIRLNYREMARALAKRAPRLRDYPMISERLDSHEAAHFDANPGHPLGLLAGLSLAVRAPRLEAQDLVAIRRDYNLASQAYCRDYAQQPQIVRRLEQAHRDPQLRLPLCETLLSRARARSLAALFQQIFSDYYTYAARRREREFRAQAELDYIDRINRNPLLLLLSSDNPDPSELLSGVRQILRLAQQRKSAFLEYRLSGKASDLRHFSAITSAFPYTRARAQDLPVADVERTFLHWQAEAARQATQHALLEAGMMVGVVTSCFLPWGRIFSAASATVIRSFCLAGVGIPLNTYFVWDAWDRYQETLELLFSSFEPGQQFSGLKSLERRLTNLQLIAILWPIGLNLKSTGEVLRLLRTTTP